MLLADKVVVVSGIGPGLGIKLAVEAARAGAYAASKGALKVLATYLANELGSFGSRVNTLLPGMMWGEPVKAHIHGLAAKQGISGEKVIERIVASIALRRIVSDDEVARPAMLPV